MLFSPVRVDAPTLSLVLQSHNALSGVDCRVYHDDNTDDESKLLLQWEAQRGAHITDSIHDLCALNPSDEYRSEETHTWTQERISRISRIRNAAIETFLASDCEFLFILDADLVVHPQTVEHLVGLNVPVVSSVFFTKWQPDAMYSPNVWDCQPFGHWGAERILRLREKGTYDVGGLGACTLIRRDVLENPNIRYTPLPSLNLEGEDRWFSVRCEAQGIPLVADTHLPPFHVYRPSQLDEARVWFEQGCDPSYFTAAWLDEEWERNVRRFGTAPHLKSFALCMPGETFSSAYVMNLLTMLKATAGMRLECFNVYSSNPSATRQGVVQGVLATGKHFDYVCWLDDDNLLTYEHVVLMMEALDAIPAIDMVAGWCDQTTDVYAKEDGEIKTSCGVMHPDGRCEAHTIDDLENAKGFVDIDWTGFPGVMMRGSLLEKLGPQAFVNIPNEKARWGMYGEDVSFCIKAKEAGAVMVCDPRIRIPHLKLRDSNRVHVPSKEKDVLSV
jgi:Glycosyltransferase like family 2